MTRAVVILLVLILAAGSFQTPVASYGTVPVDQTASLGSIIVGLLMLAPAVGVFRLMRRVGRWQRTGR